ncbi:hypothetical protein BGAL_0463g00050 [Botrytis galanthina]|uniref:Uncharacterized protein n=1 Tax=Botrytis galanthina TaxID=278940 RepID=A0A4S8QPM6_9HELO|nr:hypothetical protein BGAL_0463g00050 [Botrytis galanthina]
MSLLMPFAVSIFPSSNFPPLGLHMSQTRYGLDAMTSFNFANSSSSPSVAGGTSRKKGRTLTNPWALYNSRPSSVDSTNASSPFSSASLQPHCIIKLPAPLRRCSGSTKQ